MAYATVAAKKMGSLFSHHTIPWSGKGVVRNYGDKNSVSPNPMPLFYNRTLGGRAISSENYWDPKQFLADIFIIALGTNDFSTDPMPSFDEFTSGM